MVICAPTGSGKTAIFEMSIIRLLLSTTNFTYKIVYLAPIKALCSERYQDWTSKFGPFGLKCTELTGDTDIDDFQELHKAHIVFTTPEKWDSMTRRWRDQKSLVQTVRLFLIDEVHLLGDDVRGATMEAVVSRMKTIQVAINSEKEDSNSPAMRFLAISATIPNVNDIGSWLDTGLLPAVTFSLGDDYRPVQLRKIVLGYPCSAKQSDFKFDLALNYKLSNIIQTYSENKPTLIFGNTRKGVSQAAGILVKDARFVMNAQHKQTLTRYANIIHDSKLQELVIQGVGFHHAGLDNDDRKNVEELFLNGHLPVLFCTSTLAMGVNLPAHLVIIKGTMYYGMGGFIEYSEAQIFQMIGRAGRPQFDTSATAVIMTKQQNKEKYQNLISGTQQIESSLHLHLTEHINAEIVLGTITDSNIAQEWLKSTFLYVRMCENPKFYGAPGLDKNSIGKKLQGMCLRALKSLQALNLIEMKEGETLHSTEIGRLMARYCITYETVKLFASATGTDNIQDLLVLLSKAKEFNDIVLRQNERTILNTLNKDKHRATIRFPMSGKIKTTENKVNCLVQATLGCLSIVDFPLQQDITKIFRIGQRICKFLMEYMFLNGSFQSCLAAIILYKCVRSRLWENSKFVSRQLERIGPSLSSALVNAGIISLKKIEETNSRELELIVNRHPPFGDQIKTLVAGLPKLDVKIEQTSQKKEASASEIVLSVRILNNEKRAEHIENLKTRKQFVQGYIVIVGDADNKIVFKQKVTDIQILSDDVWTRKILVQRASKSPELTVNVISQDYVGLDYQTTFTPVYQGGFHPLPRPQSPHPNVSVKNEINRSKSAKTRVSKQACNHKCINKLWCGHQCCKMGLPSAQERPSEMYAPGFTPVHDDIADEPMSTSSRKGKSSRQKSELELSLSNVSRGSPMMRFCEEIQRKKNQFPDVRPAFKKIKVELTLENTSKKSIRDFKYNPRRLTFENHQNSGNDVDADNDVTVSSNLQQERSFDRHQQSIVVEDDNEIDITEFDETSGGEEQNNTFDDYSTNDRNQITQYKGPSIFARNNQSASTGYQQNQAFNSNPGKCFKPSPPFVRSHLNNQQPSLNRQHSSKSNDPDHTPPAKLSVYQAGPLRNQPSSSNFYSSNSYSSKSSSNNCQHSLKLTNDSNQRWNKEPFTRDQYSNPDQQNYKSLSISETTDNSSLSYQSNFNTGLPQSTNKLTLNSRSNHNLGLSYSSPYQSTNDPLKEFEAGDGYHSNFNNLCYSTVNFPRSKCNKDVNKFDRISSRKDRIPGNDYEFDSFLSHKVGPSDTESSVLRNQPSRIQKPLKPPKEDIAPVYDIPDFGSDSGKESEDDLPDVFGKRYGGDKKQSTAQERNLSTSTNDEAAYNRSNTHSQTTRQQFNSTITTTNEVITSMSNTLGGHTFQSTSHKECYGENSGVFKAATDVTKANHSKIIQPITNKKTEVSQQYSHLPMAKLHSGNMDVTHRLNKESCDPTSLKVDQNNFNESLSNPIKFHNILSTDILVKNNENLSITSMEDPDDSICFEIEKSDAKSKSSEPYNFKGKAFSGVSSLASRFFKSGSSFPTVNDENNSSLRFFNQTKNSTIDSNDSLDESKDPCRPNLSKGMPLSDKSNDMERPFENHSKVLLSSKSTKSKFAPKYDSLIETLKESYSRSKDLGIDKHPAMKSTFATRPNENLSLSPSPAINIQKEISKESNPVPSDDFIQTANLPTKHVGSDTLESDITKLLDKEQREEASRSIASIDKLPYSCKEANESIHEPVEQPRNPIIAKPNNYPFKDSIQTRNLSPRNFTSPSIFHQKDASFQDHRTTHTKEQSSKLCFHDSNRTTSVVDDAVVPPWQDSIFGEIEEQDDFGFIGLENNKLSKLQSLPSKMGEDEEKTSFDFFVDI
ncbi:uncharacterized protein [Clytia hemisphaerica]|uniref:uncharacterized protein n=1 Tax=Clytia hemisphaerica TaxID=252671 RepID=UPI0034D41D54